MTSEDIKKMDIHPKLKPFFKKAKKKGWKQGQHLFNFLSELDMMRYDNIKEEIVIQKTSKLKDEEVLKYRKYNKLIEEQKLKLKAEIEKLRRMVNWAAKFECPKCGPCSPKMVTTKKTCLICDSLLLRAPMPYIDLITKEAERLRTQNEKLKKEARRA